MALVLLLAAYLAGPGWVLLASPLIDGWLRAGLVVLMAIAVVRPRWSPAVLIGIVPLLPIWPSVVPSVPVGIVHLVVATQAVPWLLRGLVGRRGSDNAMVPGWALLVAVATVSLAVTFTPEPWRGIDPGHVWRQINAQVPAYIFEADDRTASRSLAAWTVLADGLVCALIVGWAVTRETRERTLRAAGVSAALTAVAGMGQAATGIGLQSAWRVFDAGIIRINATYVDPNALAAFYALVGPILAGLTFRSAGWRRVSWGAATALVVVAMVMTAGRAGLVALAAGFLMAAWTGLRYGLDSVDPWVAVRRHARRTVAAAVVAIAVLVACLTVVGTVQDVRHEQQTSYLHTWLYTFNLRQPPDAVAKGRLAVWRVAREMVREHPLAGQGLGESVTQFERVRAALAIDSLPRDARLSPHNTYLLVAAELGALGLAAFLLMITAVVIGIRSPGNLVARAATSWPTAGLIGGLVGYGLTMLTGDRILLREDVVAGTICAALATLRARPLPRVWYGAAVAVLGVALVVWPVRTGWAGGGPRVHSLPPHEGLHADQIGTRGETYRWSTGEAVLYVPADARRVTIPVRNLSTQTQRLDIDVDDRPADRRNLVPGSWVTLEYRLPPHPDSRWHAIRLRVTPTWQAPGDGRVLGVVIGDWGYR